MKVPMRLALEGALVAAVAIQGWMLWGRPSGPAAGPGAPLPPSYMPGVVVGEPLPGLPGQGVAVVSAWVKPDRKPPAADVPVILPWGQVVPGAEPQQAPDVPPVAWPTREDLHGACKVSLARGDGTLGAEAWWPGCLRMPGGADLCRGPILADQASMDVQVAAREIPKPWAAEARLLATFPDPGFRAGLSMYRRGRWGWAAAYSIPKESLVSLKIYDVMGREVVELVNGKQTAGSYTVDFDAASLASGTYFYKLTAGEFISVKKMVLLK